MTLDVTEQAGGDGPEPVLSADHCSSPVAVFASAGRSSGHTGTAADRSNAREASVTRSRRTNLDAAEGGVADCLADTLGLNAADRQKVGPYGRLGNCPDRC